jgi:hypothetical protein
MVGLTENGAAGEGRNIRYSKKLNFGFGFRADRGATNIQYSKKLNFEFAFGADRGAER